MQIRDAIVAFGDDYLTYQVPAAHDLRLKAIPGGYVTDLYAGEFAYDAVTAHFNAFLHIALNYKKYDVATRRRINEVFRQADIIKGEGHSRSENNLTAIVAVYLGARTPFTTLTGADMHGERYENDPHASKLFTTVENNRLEFLSGWSFCTMYVLDTLCLAAHLNAVTVASTELTIAQQVWFQELNTWFADLLTLNAAVRA